MCPITQELIVEPASTIYGHLYELSAIQHWVNQKGTCPLTNQPLRNDQIYPQFGLKATIEEMRAMKQNQLDSNKRIAELEAQLGAAGNDGATGAAKDGIVAATVATVATDNNAATAATDNSAATAAADDQTVSGGWFSWLGGGETCGSAVQPPSPTATEARPVAADPVEETKETDEVFVFSEHQPEENVEEEKNDTALLDDISLVKDLSVYSSIEANNESLIIQEVVQEQQNEEEGGLWSYLGYSSARAEPTEEAKVEVEVQIEEKEDQAIVE